MRNIFVDKARNKRLLVNLICLIISLAVVSMMLPGIVNFTVSGTDFEAKKNWAVVITMLLSSLCGPLTASLMELILFIYMAFGSWDINSTFGLFVILTSAIIAVVPLKKGWYKRRWKTLLTIPFFSVLIDMAFSFVGIAYGMGELADSDLSYRINLKFNSGLYLSLVVAVCYVFCNYAP